MPKVAAPYVVDEVRCGWRVKPVQLEGRATIKVLLGTGDRRVARDRWASIHAQIDALVQLAVVQANRRPAVAMRIARIAALSNEDRATSRGKHGMTFVRITTKGPIPLTGRRWRGDRLGRARMCAGMRSRRASAGH